MKILVLHHTDTDGAVSGAIVGLRHKGDLVTYRLYNYGYPINREDLDPYDLVYAVDISFHETDPWIYLYLKDKLVWIDHHKTALEYEKNNGLDIIKGYRKIGKGACELVWEYMYPDIPCPKLIQILSAYDVWDKNRFTWSDVEKVEYGFKHVFGISACDICDFLGGNYNLNPAQFKEKGEIIIEYLEKTFKSKLLGSGFFINNLEIPGAGIFKIMMLNTLDFTSKSFQAYYNPNIFDIMIPFSIIPDEPGKIKIRISFYTENPEIDCSKIAEFFGGGGHQGAAGAVIPIETLKKFLDSSCSLKSYLEYLGIKK